MPWAESLDHRERFAALAPRLDELPARGEKPRGRAADLRGGHGQPEAERVLEALGPPCVRERELSGNAGDLDHRRGDPGTAAPALVLRRRRVRDGGVLFRVSEI